MYRSWHARQGLPPQLVRGDLDAASRRADIAEAITKWARSAHTEWNRLATFEAYYWGVHRSPYEPETATRRVPGTGLAVRHEPHETHRQHVDATSRSSTGSGPARRSMENAPQWEWWQQNGLDARQKALYDEAAKNGYAGCMVLPGEPPR